MKAVVQQRYGPPDVLRIEEVERPVPKSDELLVRIHAAAVTRTDCGYRAPHPYLLMRLVNGLFRPKRHILGSEFGGVVEAVGADVTRFKVGDRIFGGTGFRVGAHAEHLCVSERARIAHLPEGLTFVEAASICEGAVYALSGLRGIKLRAGQRILVYGASGAIGTATVQLAKQMGAHVTAVCDTKSVEVVRSLGPDVVIDYTREDFTKNGETYDVISDVVGKHSFFRCRG
jgi:NADPH:quinone reductase-like Zn-dependent oxidoreductase